MASGISIFAITVWIWHAAQQSENHNLQVANDFDLLALQKEIEHDFGERVRAVERMAARVSDPHFTPPQWRADAIQHLAHFPDLNSIAIVDKNYYIEDVRPEKLLPLIRPRRQFNWDEKRKAALQRAAENKKSSVTGLVPLISGSKGIVIVSPILRQNEIDGYLLAVIKPEPFFRNLARSNRNKLQVKENGQIVFEDFKDESGENNSVLSKSLLPFYGVELELSVAPTAATLEKSNSHFPESILFSGLIISILFFLTLTLARAARMREEKAKTTSQRLEKILSLAPVAIFETDTEGKCVYVNKTWTRYTGLPLEESVGDGWARALHPDDVNQVFYSWLSAVEAKQSFQLKFRYKNVSSGEIYWIDCRAEKMLGLKGELLGYLGVAVDFKSEKEAEKSARETKEFLAEVLDNLPVALFCKDSTQEFKFTLWNRAAERIWNKDRRDILGRNDFEVFPRNTADSYRQQDLDVIYKNAAVEILNEEYDGSSSTRHLNLKKVPVNGSNGQARFLLGIAEDITDKVKTEKLLEEQRLKIFESERLTLLGELAGGIAHEINNPLTIIEGYSHQIRSTVSKEVIDKARLEKASDGISLTVERIAKIIKGLKAFARDGAQDPMEVVKISDLLKETLEFCQTRFSRQGVEISVEIEDPESEIRCRKIQISQVILNLLMNAFDAVAGANSARIRVKSFQEEEYIKITVADSGAGIPKEILGKIMNPFFTTKRNNGSGLGLSISSNIVKSHGGRLYVDNQSVETTFVIEIPYSATEGVGREL